jgi:hypothetical protein
LQNLILSLRQGVCNLLIPNEPVAKPPVLQLAGGAKLRPAEVGFGVTPHESTNYRKLAEGSENEDG